MSTRNTVPVVHDAILHCADVTTLTIPLTQNSVEPIAEVTVMAQIARDAKLPFCTLRSRPLAQHFQELQHLRGCGHSRNVSKSESERRQSNFIASRQPTRLSVSWTDKDGNSVHDHCHDEMRQACSKTCTVYQEKNKMRIDKLNKLQTPDQNKSDVINCKGTVHAGHSNVRSSGLKKPMESQQR